MVIQRAASQRRHLNVISPTDASPWYDIPRRATMPLDAFYI